MTVSSNGESKSKNSGVSMSERDSVIVSKNEGNNKGDNERGRVTVLL